MKQKKTFRLFLSNFPDVIQAVTDGARRNKKTNTLKTSSLALKLGYNLKKIANIMEFEGRITGDEVTSFEMCSSSNKYVTLSGMRVRLLRHSEILMRQNGTNAPQLLPFAKDNKKMHANLNKVRKEFQTKLREESE